MNFGIIGCKTIAAIHKGALLSIKNANIAGVYDIIHERAVSFSEGTNAVVYNSLEEILASPDIDAVCICTPSGIHSQQAVAAAYAKKHVIVEKPVSITRDQMQDIRDACQKNDVVLTVISQLTFSEDFQKLKFLIKNEALGRLLLCDLSMKYYRSAEYYTDGGWRGTKEMDGGGALMNQGIHGISLMLQLMGEVKAVTAHARTLLHNIEVEDTVIALLEFKSGAIGSVIATTSVQPAQARVLNINGTKGTAVLTEDVLSKLRLEGEPDYDAVDNTPRIFDSELHRRQITDFITAVEKGTKPFLDLESGCRPVELILAIYESSEKQQTIYFD